MAWRLSKDKFTYILRYYLPCLPQYDEKVTKARGNELIDFCKKHSVDAVMLYVDLNPYWYYMPDTEEHNSYLVDMITPLAKKLRKNGISYQLNYQNLFGAWDGNYDHRSMYNWECYIDEFGRESMGVGCMIGETFREIAGRKLSLWAETKPDVIWIDDDIRYHNHRTGIHDFWAGKTDGEGLDFGCFCDKHIALFNSKYGLSVNREDITASMLNKNTDKKLGILYRDFLNETLCDTAKWIEHTVHSVSPDTRVAVMTSLPDVHSLEGRNWGDFLSTLSGKYAPLLRPTFGPYAEGNPRDFNSCYSLICQLQEDIKNHYYNTFDMCPEIENTRFTVYSKSIAATSYQIMLSAFLGCRGVTLSIYDLEGVRLEDEEEFGTLLSDRKAFCDKMTSFDTNGCKKVGISFITAPDRLPDTSGRRISNLIPGRGFEKILTKAGFPYKYATPKDIADCEAIVLDRYAVRCLDDCELIAALSKPLILDSGAADEIQERGYAEHLGIAVGEKISEIASSEILSTIKRDDGTDAIIPSRIRGNAWRHLTLSSAEALSRLVIPSGKEFPGITIFKNSLGGKICVFAGEDDFGDAFFSNFRIKLLREIINELCPSSAIVQFKSYGAVVQLCGLNKEFLFITNLSADPQKDLNVVLPYMPSKVTVLCEDGSEKIVAVAGNTVEINNELQIYNSVVLCIDK